jgi:hypothetical protein
LAIDYAAEIAALEETMAIIRRSPEQMVTIEGHQYQMSDLAKLRTERNALLREQARANGTHGRVRIRRYVAGSSG